MSHVSSACNVRNRTLTLTVVGGSMNDRETYVTASNRLGDDNARLEMEALRSMTQEERLRVLIGSVAETGGTPEANNGAAFRERLKAQKPARRRRASSVTPA